MNSMTYTVHPKIEYVNMCVLYESDWDKVKLKLALNNIIGYNRSQNLVMIYPYNSPKGDIHNDLVVSIWIWDGLESRQYIRKRESKSGGDPNYSPPFYEKSTYIEWRSTDCKFWKIHAGRFISRDRLDLPHNFPSSKEPNEEGNYRQTISTTNWKTLPTLEPRLM